VDTIAIAEKWQRFVAADNKQRVRLFVRKLIYLLILKPLAFLLHLVLHLISLGRPVRIGTLIAKGKISIMISYIEPYMRQLRLEGVRNPLVVVINPGKCPNEQLSRMYGRAVQLLDDRHPRLRRLFSFLLRLLAASGSRTVAHLQGADFTPYLRAWGEGGPVLRFTPEERERGQHLLAQMNMSAGVTYICFGLREAAFYQQFLTPESLARYTNPEDRENTYIRNPPLQNYLPMAAHCAEQGLYVLRMGQVAGEPLPSGLHPNIIDYAMKYRTSFGDVYLLANCKFVVAGVAGLWWIATAFNRPIVMSDSPTLHLGAGLRNGDLFIPKKVWVIAEKRLLTFPEMLKADIRYSYEDNCHRDGMELVHNTPEEIAAVVSEMNRRLDGTWSPSDEDEDLQRRFKEMLFSYQHPKSYGLPVRIGAEFLRQHADLL